MRLSQVLSVACSDCFAKILLKRLKLAQMWAIVFQFHCNILTLRCHDGAAFCPHIISIYIYIYIYIYIFIDTAISCLMASHVVQQFADHLVLVF